MNILNPKINIFIHDPPDVVLEAATTTGSEQFCLTGLSIEHMAHIAVC